MAAVVEPLPVPLASAEAFVLAKAAWDPGYRKVSGHCGGCAHGMTYLDRSPSSVDFSLRPVEQLLKQHSLYLYLWPVLHLL